MLFNSVAIESKKMEETLPQEIIFEIFLRLPVKSVLKFRCVSKSWLSLLSTPLFNKAHFKFSLNNANNTNFRLAVVASGPSLGRSCHVYNIGSENSLVKHACPPNSLSLSARILGSCNGLICFTNDSSTLMLSNPSIAVFKIFPNPMLQSKRGGNCYVRYGFGYDASVEDFKFVKIFSFPQTEGRCENIVKVYSLKANSWSTVQGFNCIFINGNVGLFANGVLHWEVCYGDSSSYSWEIATMDLATVRYGTIALPSCDDRVSYWTLGVSRGYLVACCQKHKSTADMWVMKDYGFDKSWTKLATISLPDSLVLLISPLLVAENGDEVLLKIDGKIMLYNSRNASFKQLDNFVSDGFRQVHVATYVDSLASPHT